MSKYIDLVGQKFGRLTVLSYSGKSSNGSLMWNCKCECGKEKAVAGYLMKRGDTLSCGCLAHDFTVNKNKTHNMSKTPIYAVWVSMKARCLNPNDKSYKDYGKRGIKVCDKWLKFEGFYEDMGSSYKRGLTIERKDVNKGYNPENCLWETRLVQGNNTRRNHIETVQGITGTLSELSRHFKIPYTTIMRRIERGWDIERTFLTPRLREGNITNKKYI